MAQPGHIADDGCGDVAFEHVGRVQMLVDGARSHEIQRRLHALAQIERLRLDVHAAGFNLGKIEDVVDDGQQRIAGFTDGGNVILLFGVEFGVEQKATHADHGVHRRADLVAHRGEERALGLVRPFGGGARLLRLLEQPRVLDGDHRLVGEGFEQRSILVSERHWRMAHHVDGADALALPQHGCDQHRNVAYAPGEVAHDLRHPRAVRHVRVMHHALLAQRVGLVSLLQRPGKAPIQFAHPFRVIGGTGVVVYLPVFAHQRQHRVRAIE